MVHVFEEAQKVVDKLSKEDVDGLMHRLDHCVLMANKFEETRKAEHYARMKPACTTFLET